MLIVWRLRENLATIAGSKKVSSGKERAEHLVSLSKEKQWVKLNVNMYAPKD